MLIVFRARSSESACPLSRRVPTERLSHFLDRAAFVDFDASSGLVHHVGMRGRAGVEDWNEERAKRILRHYLGPDEEHWDRGRFIEPLGDPDNLLVRFTPEIVVARDQPYRAPPPAQSELGLGTSDATPSSGRPF